MSLGPPCGQTLGGQAGARGGQDPALAQGVPRRQQQGTADSGLGRGTPGFQFFLQGSIWLHAALPRWAEPDLLQFKGGCVALVSKGGEEHPRRCSGNWQGGLTGAVFWEGLCFWPDAECSALGTLCSVTPPLRLPLGHLFSETSDWESNRPLRPLEL